MLTDIKLKNLKPTGKSFKVSDRDGLYAAVTAAGAVSFRYDYRIHGRRETLTLGRYDAARAKDLQRAPDALNYGDSLSLAEARTLLSRARRAVESKESPARSKAEQRSASTDAMAFGGWADKYFEESEFAESTRAMRKAIYLRDLAKPFGRLKLEEITPSMLLALCEKIKKDRDAPATAVHVREIVQQVYRFVQARGLKVESPADSIRASAIATFKPRERALSPAEIREFYGVLDTVGTLPQLRLGLKFVLLSMLRKCEILNARWTWVDFEAATMTVPAEFMKARRAHTVYLSQQLLDILTALKAFAGSSPYVLPGRYETDQPMSAPALNRVIEVAVQKQRAEAEGSNRVMLEPFSVHDLRRTASTLLHEAGFNSDWIEKSLAHEQRGVRAVYNRAEYADQRREMLQTWADMVDGWVKGAKVVAIGQGIRKAA